MLKLIVGLSFKNKYILQLNKGSRDHSKKETSSYLAMKLLATHSTGTIGYYSSPREIQHQNIMLKVQLEKN